MERQGEVARGSARDAREPAEARALVVAHHHELVEEPAIVAGLTTRERRLVRLARALPPLPGPVPLGLFLVAIVVGQRAERLQVLGAMEREPAQRILAVERAAADAEVRG